MSGDVWTTGVSIQSKALNPRTDSPVENRFERLSSAKTGIGLVPAFPEEANVEMLYDQTSGNGVAVGDYDGDGLPDIYFSNYSGENRLFRNLGEWKFEDVTDKAGVACSGVWTGGVAFADVDNDGDLDLFVCAYDAENRLFVNEGNGSFSEQAKGFGLDYRGVSSMMSFADYDNDGDLDGYLVTHRLRLEEAGEVPNSAKEAFDRGIIVMNESGKPVIARKYRKWYHLFDLGNGGYRIHIAGSEDVLYRNDGKGRFEIVNGTAGISGYDIGLSANWWDYNHDGNLDIYVSNDYKGADKLYRNNGDGTFTDVVEDVVPHMPWYSMGADAADVNNDGRIDFLATDMAGSNHYRSKMAMGDMSKDRWFLVNSNPQQYMRNALFLNTGVGRMFEAAQMLNVANTDWTWSPKFGDLNNDGWVDLFITNGMSRDFMNSDLQRSEVQRGGEMWRDMPIFKQENMAFENRHGDFSEVGREWGLDELSAAYGAALADFDRDGDLDIVVSNFGQEVSLFENRSCGHHSVLLRLVGVRSNRWGVGARVEAHVSDSVQVRQLMLAQGFMSSNEPIVHFGLGQNSFVDELIVEWPSGVRQRFENLEANRLYTITESVEYAESVQRPEDSVSFFEEMKAAPYFQHTERSYDDYTRQPLIPQKVSQLSAGIAVGDADGDGRDDYYFCGPKGQSGALVFGKGRGTVEPFKDDALSEDMSALFFDADSDGDLDLYVVSGSNEYEPGDALLADRLYLNQGKGRFKKAAPGLIPEFRDSGSAVAAADFDRDGDLDLFVGGYAVPGQYPLAADNHLLRNEGGTFVAIDSEANGLAKSGIVTSALWTDADGDGWIDLMLAHRWGAPRLFRNDQGRLVDSSRGAGLAELTGWWQGIAGGDFDHDGDMDYALTNTGLNTKYKATAEKPATLFFGDVEGTGKSKIIEAKYEKDVCYPVRGFSCSSYAIPSLRKKFDTYNSFALSSLQDIYSEITLGAMNKLEAVTLESGVLLNDGDAKFVFKPLPRLAQIAPGNGVVVSDFNGDRHQDLFIAQNNYSPEPETGHMDGGLSLLLAGDGLGGFKAIWPSESGIVIPGDAKSVVMSYVDDDAWPDLLVGRNNDSSIALRHKQMEGADAVRVKLKGQPGNPNAIGARVRIYDTEELMQMEEVAAGSGYMAQSTSILAFTAMKPLTLARIEVLWPNGRNSVLESPQADANGLIVIEQP